MVARVAADNMAATIFFGMMNSARLDRDARPVSTTAPACCALRVHRECDMATRSDEFANKNVFHNGGDLVQPFFDLTDASSNKKTSRTGGF
jgi:hypothetical protein